MENFILEMDVIMNERQTIDEIYIELLKELEDKSAWNLAKDGGRAVEHKTKNIQVNIYSIWFPRSIRHPFRWKRKIKKRINEIFNFSRLEDYNFILDYFKGVYPYYYKYSQIDPNIQEWLSTLDLNNIKIDNHCIYFKKQEDYAYLVLKWM